MARIDRYDEALKMERFLEQLIHGGDDRGGDVRKDAKAASEILAGADDDDLRRTRPRKVPQKTIIREDDSNISDLIDDMIDMQRTRRRMSYAMNSHTEVYVRFPCRRFRP